MLTKLKWLSEWLFYPVGSLFVRLRITPNMITIATIPLAIITSYEFYLENFILAGVLVLLTGFFDLLDGIVARISLKKTVFGALLDSSIDRVSEGIIYLGIALLSYTFLGLSVAIYSFLAFFTSSLVSYVKARAEGLELVAAGGLAERAERLIILAVSSMLAAKNPLLLVYGLIVITLVSASTFLYRLGSANK